MKRTPQQWQDFDPSRAINRLSRPALRVALEDARADILDLVAALRHVRHYGGSGVCMCGEDMQHHSQTATHMPVDVLDNYIDKVLGE